MSSAEREDRMSLNQHGQRGQPPEENTYGWWPETAFMASPLM